jgi:hypothetical protein
LAGLNGQNFWQGQLQVCKCGLLVLFSANKYMKFINIQTNTGLQFWDGFIHYYMHADMYTYLPTYKKHTCIFGRKFSAEMKFRKIDPGWVKQNVDFRKSTPPRIQCDQIGKSFTSWTIVYFGQFIENYRSLPNVKATLFHGKRHASILTKKVDWATF